MVVPVSAASRMTREVPAPDGTAVSSPVCAAAVSVAIPTFGRDSVLVATVAEVLQQTCQPAEVLVLDQTPRHEPETERRLGEWDSQGRIRWLRLAAPSITGAMNRALSEAACPVVLFLDDDVVPGPELVAAHARCYADESVWAVVGQVLQPGEEAQDVAPRGPRTGLRADLDFPFHSVRRCEVRSAMAGNLSVRRERALEIGGFDENFVRVAYRFETEFCRRIWRAGGKALFEPSAGIRHLRAERGGTRTHGDHLRSPRPDHSVGDYYFALRQGVTAETLLYVARRLARSVATRFHLRHPWWIPPKLVGELRGLGLAMRLAARGQKLLHVENGKAAREG